MRGGESEDGDKGDGRGSRRRRRGEREGEEEEDGDRVRTCAQHNNTHVILSFHFFCRVEGQGTVIAMMMTTSRLLRVVP